MFYRSGELAEMKLTKLPVANNKIVTAMPGNVIQEDGNKRILPKGSVIEHKGRKWELTQPVEVIEK